MSDDDPYRRQVSGCSAVLAVLVPVVLLAMLGYLAYVHSASHRPGFWWEALILVGVTAVGAGAGAGWSWLASRRTDRLWFSAGLGAAVPVPFLAVYTFLSALHVGLAGVHIPW
ncbi:hypothetical protein [Kitasatospora sp. NPDC089509]|uniref:hypothetical protein n=1 Tax=Kitasatospora sp. NPDC089509 TaxID=3364079 RepID=UPI00381EF21A